MKKLFPFLALAILCQFNVNAQNKKLIKYQYSPDQNKRVLTSKITDTASTYFKNTKMYWFKLGGDTIIHVWQKELDSNMRVGRPYTFKGVKKMVYRFK
ncbi:MAG: hypothetical protein EOO47_21955 [Flavobacterium sp.]|nr:MAG: hypothetical protein EOO47_21955 [Flavobacterium sp.]